MKYIDADKLIAEIDRLKEETPIGICEYDKGVENGRMEVITSLQSTIDSLQQEQQKTEIPNTLICKENLVKYLEPKIEQQARVVLIYVQDKCFEGGKLAAYKEILQDVKRM